MAEAAAQEPVAEPETALDTESETALASGAVSLTRPSPRGDLARRLSAPLPDAIDEPTIVPTPPNIALRPTIDWAEIEPPARAKEPAPDDLEPVQPADPAAPAPLVSEPEP